MKFTPLSLGLLLAIAAATPLRAQISAFTYQGRLDLNGAPANGRYDFMFRLLNDPTNGVAAPVIQVNLAVFVTNGLFTTGMDFGAENFDGANRWLEINVRTNGGGPFTTLSPRQVLFPTPYAITANTASNLLGALPAGQISGTILNASLPASPSFSGTVTANNFSGNGAGLSVVNAATLGGMNSSNFWRTTGNAGTTAGTHFLGTTDNQPLELRVNNQRGLRLETGIGGYVNVIGGWSGNSVTPAVGGATISGGGRNRVDAHYGTVSGGSDNLIQSNTWVATIGGGTGNTIQAEANYATISGGELNTIGEDAIYAAIGGGRGNTIKTNAWYAAIGGGVGNTIETNSFYGTIGGGIGNTIAAHSPMATIGGGWANTIQTSTWRATIGGGQQNTIAPNGDFATIAGGISNTIEPNADRATIGGGAYNTVQTNGSAATIPGGAYNSATNFAFAAGYHAKANHTGAFVWGDSTDADIASTNANSVTMRASGGYRLFADTNATTGAFLAAGSGSWTSMSDRNAKENFRAADTRAVLEKVVALPVQTWNYKSQAAGIRHIGPMAQDFKAAFGVGESDTGIATVDADGVALAAIQGLNQKLEETRAENAELQKRLMELEQTVRKLNSGGSQPGESSTIPTTKQIAGRW